MSGQDVTIRLHFAEPLTRAMKVLLFIFTGFFLLWMILPSFQEFALRYLALNQGDFLGRLRLWQLVTSIFLHGDVMHFLGNMIFFWLFGSALAKVWREKEFLFFFFFCGIAASLCAWGYDALTGGPPARVSLGSSGAVFGLMIGYAMLFGDRIILAFFMIPMKARYFVSILMAIEILMVWNAVQDGVGHMAHVSGAIAGAGFITWRRRQQRTLAGVTDGPRSADSRIGGLEVMDDVD